MTSIAGPEPRTIIADANVLYSNEQRNILVTFSLEKLIALRWTNEIETEWVDNLVWKNPSVQRANIERTCRLMREAIPEHAVTWNDEHVRGVGETDPKDRHVAAAAIARAPSILTTWNARDFDKRALSLSGVEIMTPDELLCGIFDLHPALALGASRRAFSYVRKADGKPEWADYLEVLATKGKPCSLATFAEKLRRFASTRGSTR